MSSPISPGDVVEIAKGVYKLFKKFKDAPKEMNVLREQLRLFTTLLRHSDDEIMQLDFLKKPEGKDLLVILCSHLRKLKRILRQIKSVGKEWERAQEKWYRRAPFVLYTMRAIPGLQADLELEMHFVDSIKTQAFHIGIPAALKQLDVKIDEQKRRQNSSKKRDDFTACEQRRRKAESVLRNSARMQLATSIAEQKDQISTALRQSGLGGVEAQNLAELYINDKKLKETADSLASKNSDASGKGIKPVQRVKSFPIGNSKPKVQVVVPKKSNKPEDAAKKAKPSPGSAKVDTKSITPKRQPKDDQKKPEKIISKPKIAVIKNNDTKDILVIPKKTDKAQPKPKVTVIKNDGSDSGKNNPKESDKKSPKDSKQESDKGGKTDKLKPEKKKEQGNASTDAQNGKQNNKKKAEEKPSKDPKGSENKEKQGKKQDNSKANSNQVDNSKKESKPKKPEKKAEDPPNKNEAQKKQQEDKSTGKKEKKQDNPKGDAKEKKDLEKKSKPKDQSLAAAV